MAGRKRFAFRFPARSRAVWVAAIVSQIAIIGGVFAWGSVLAGEATATLPASVTAKIDTWVSDPAWQVAPTLSVNEHSWLLGLSSPQGSSFAAAHPDAEAVVVLWGDAELTSPQPDCILGQVLFNCTRPMSSAAPGSYQQVQVPVAQADHYLKPLEASAIPGFPGPTVPAQVFRVSAGDYYTVGEHRRSVFPVLGQVSPDLLVTTSAGWSAYVPSLEPGDVTGPGCTAGRANLPAAIAAAVGASPQGWYAAPCPAPSVQLLAGPDERFSDSTTLPTSASGSVTTWTSPPAKPGKYAALFVGGFWADVADPAIAVAAQRDLLFAGVLDGVAGGILAAWLIAGVTVLVKRLTGPGAGRGEAAGSPSPADLPPPVGSPPAGSEAVPDTAAEPGAAPSG
jgi:hypothetical protein